MLLMYRIDKNGAGDGSRTRDPKLGKLVLYQLSYARFSSGIITTDLPDVNRKTDGKKRYRTALMSFSRSSSLPKPRYRFEILPSLSRIRIRGIVRT